MRGAGWREEVGNGMAGKYLGLHFITGYGAYLLAFGHGGTVVVVVSAGFIDVSTRGGRRSIF